jgi:hypothetical protein
METETIRNIDPNKVYFDVVDKDKNFVTDISLLKKFFNNAHLGRAIKRLMALAQEENLDMSKLHVVVYSYQKELDSITFH